MRAVMENRPWTGLQNAPNPATFRNYAAVLVARDQ